MALAATRTGADPTERALTLDEAAMPAQAGTIPSLDGLRAISITLVLLSHFVNPRLFPGGLGVLVFFVISGFLISRLLLAELKRDGRVSLPHFYARRLLRLYLVIIAYTVIVLVATALAGAPIDPLQPLSALLYFANYLYSSYQFQEVTSGLMPFAIFWSLSVEEHFYLVFPPLLVALRGNANRLLAILLLVCGACLALRFAVATLRPDYIGTFVFYYRTEFRLDSLATGVLIAVLCELAWGRRLLLRLAHPAVFAASLALVVGCLVYRDPFFRETFRYTGLNVAVTLLIVGILFSPRYRPLALVLNSGPAVWLGQLSYSIYVWHLVVPIVLFHLGLQKGPLMIALEFVGTLLVASASYYCLERPLVSLRHRLRAVPTAHP